MIDPVPAIPELVAHRGYALRHPENTLAALRAAVEAGARHVEFDVQLCREGVPVLMHDASLQRTAGVPGAVTEWSLAALGELDVGERERLGPGAERVPVPTLDEIVALLAAWPGVTAFVEIKPTSLERFGTDPTVRRVLAALAPVRERSVVISYEHDAIAAAREHGAAAIGWVIRGADDQTRRRARALAPEYLFCRHDRLPEPPWPGPWRWAVYDADSVEMALDLAHRGAHLVETMAIAELLGDSRLAPEAPR
jgi:glycerophosphoryl diester phosphodiesterase